MTKQTIGCRVTSDELTQIDNISQQLGHSRSEWLHSLIHRELTGTDLTTVKGLEQRVTAIELRLARLAK